MLKTNVGLYTKSIFMKQQKTQPFFDCVFSFIICLFVVLLNYVSHSADNR